MTDTTAGAHGEWLDRYRHAWMTKDAAAARELFTPDAVYREQPFDPPLVGSEAIAGYWSRVTATQRDIRLRYGRPVAEGHRVAVEWWVTLVNDEAPYTLAGEFLLLFGEDGRCHELREYWAITEGAHEPPAGWGT